jgi:histidyl-tRNA synthetase
MTIQLDPLLGLRDFYPEDMRVRNWLFGTWKEVAKQYGFSEYDAAMVEREELYTRKAGEEIVGQMYNFEDKDKNKVSLRPEMTPTLVRMVMNKLVLNSTGTITSSELFPLKWFSIPQCWRFETPQRGRKREHYQWNMDIIGTPDVSAELELISASVSFFEKVGLTENDIVFRINSRRVLNEAMIRASVPDDKFAAACVVLDKFDKVGNTDAERKREVLRQLVKDVGLPESVAEEVVKTRELSLEQIADLPGGAELISLFNRARDYGIDKWLQFDPTVVRGLAYYTGVVWETFVKTNNASEQDAPIVDGAAPVKFRAVSGGGRYDRLFSLYGSPVQVPCVGYGFGDCVIVEVLKDRNLIPELRPRVDFLVGAWKGMTGGALRVARELRKSGATVDVMLEECKRPAKIFTQADKVGADKVAFVAPDELEKGLVRIKDLRSGDKDNRVQKDIPINDLVNWRTYFETSA